MSGVLQLCKSFGLNRFRRQLKHPCFWLHYTFLCRTARHDEPHVLFCPRLDAVSLEKGGHTRCAAVRRDPRAACRRVGVSHQDRSWWLLPGSRMLFRGRSFGPQGARLGLTRHWSSRRCDWPWCISSVVRRVVCEFVRN